MIPQYQRKFYRLIEWDGNGIGCTVIPVTDNDYDKIMEMRKFKLTRTQAVEKHGKMFMARLFIPCSEIITYNTKTDYERSVNGKHKIYY